MTAQLSQHDLNLLNTQFDYGVEKTAQEKLAFVQGLCLKGQEMAIETCDSFDKIAAEEAEEKAKMEEEEEEENEEEEEKTASALNKHASQAGAFIEKAFSDTMMKLGSERFNNEFHYLLPYMEQKIAEAGAEAALEKVASKLDAIRALSRKAMSGARSGAGSSMGNTKGAFSDLKSALTGTSSTGKKITGGSRAAAAGKGVGKLAPGAALGTAALGTGYLAGKN